MKRIYQNILQDHFASYQQMAFLCGPRQVGKTTLTEQSEELAHYFRYFNWDNLADREKLLGDFGNLLADLPMDVVLDTKPLIAFDEIHKYKKWKIFLKGFYDQYKSKLHMLVTGSSRLNVFRRGGDSLMGRYFLYRIHPLSVAEILRPEWSKQLYSPPQKISETDWDNLFNFGGFPEPFLKQDKLFYNRWQNLRQEQLFKEDIRELASIQELAQLEVLAEVLKNQAGQLVSYSNLAKKVRVSDPTIRRWIKTLESFYYCFTIKPWTKNVTRSLLKEPKIYLTDWSVIQDYGAKVENFVASQLLKAVHFWTDTGLGKFDLYFLRDKEKREVDFLVTQDGTPWLMVEVKASVNEPLSKTLTLFKEQIKPQHVLQLAFDLPYVAQDCFALNEPRIVSMRTFLSQLI